MKRSSEFLNGLLCLGFVICGIVTVAAGPLLPVLARQWNLRDAQSGWFFAVQFVFSTAAAIVSPFHLRRNLPGGFALMTTGLFLLCLALNARGPSGYPLGLGAFSLIGVGIGLSVTATNLQVGRDPGRHRARRLSVVNLFWGAGAVACPPIIASAERSGHLLLALLLLGAVAAGLSVAIALLMSRVPEENGLRPRTSLAVDLRPLVFFALFLFLYVGTENAVGGWITTYTHRFNGMSLERASLMASLYWLALLGGRGLGSLALRVLPERKVLFAGLLLALAAVILFLNPHRAGLVVAEVVGAGVGFGPLFPIVISRMLARVNDARRTGWVFALSASGGAALPWLTGQLSTQTGSLRVGFLVPCVSLMAILALATMESRWMRRPPPVLRSDEPGT
jgi:fucose permease